MVISGAIESHFWDANEQLEGKDILWRNYDKLEMLV